MLKQNYDISNGKFFVEDLLYQETNYKNFLTDDNFDEIMEIWNKYVPNTVCKTWLISG